MFAAWLATLALLGLFAAAPASAQVSFTKAWGWGVRDGKSRFETCTTATTCQNGVAGGGAGQLQQVAEDVAVNGLGDVFVADSGNERIQEFSSSGSFIKAWGWGVRDGKSQFEICTTATGCRAGRSGAHAGQLDLPIGIAVDPSGDVVVADASNNRIDEFSPSGGFIQAWGWGVRDGKSQFEICTTATTCQAGQEDGDAGAFWFPQGVAVDDSGDVFVADSGNARVDEFSSTGQFIRAWGWSVSEFLFGHFQTCTTATGCYSGYPGPAAGELNEPTGIAVDRSGDVLVTDSDNHRVDEFSLANGQVSFTRAWGWDVLDGKDQLETCTTATGCTSGIGGPYAGAISDPGEIAVDHSGDAFVTDGSENWVQEFSLAGAQPSFIKAWGWGVRDGKGRFEICTAATGCKEGLAGGAGAVESATGVALDRSGDAFVTAAFGSRVNKFRLNGLGALPLVYAGYADGYRQGKVSAPSPWQGSPGVIFKGCNYFRPDRCPTTNSGADLYDAGAIRIDNTTGTTLTVTKASVTIGSCTLDPWPALKVTVPAGEQLILTQTGGTAPCHLREGKRNFDTSDTSHSCTTSDHLVPRLHVGIDGAVESFSDRSEILNTGGLDVGDKACGSHNETHSWGMMSRPPT